MSIDRRPTLDDLNERLEGKAEKQMLINGLMNKPTKAEVEQLIN